MSELNPHYSPLPNRKGAFALILGIRRPLMQIPCTPSAKGLAAGLGHTAWTSLGVSRRELSLDYTLPTGQTFRWRRTGSGEYTGVIGTRVVRGVDPTSHSRDDQ